MIATFLFEIISAIYIIWRYTFNNKTRLIVAILLCLAIFQYAEYVICQGLGIEWAKIGFMAITLLPPLGFHLAQDISGRYSRLALTMAYASGVIFAGYFLFSEAIARSVCGGNYVIFEHTDPSGILYGLYYYGWLIIGLTYTMWTASRTHAKNLHRTRKALWLLAIAYILFMVPTTIVNLVDPTTIVAIPSIMCGFAVILAIILVGFIMPRIGQVRAKGKTLRYTNK
jgi:hypothetical protein